MTKANRSKPIICGGERDWEVWRTALRKVREEKTSTNWDKGKWAEGYKKRAKRGGR